MKLRITLYSSVQINCHMLAFSDHPPNEVPARNPFTPPVVLPLLILVVSSENQSLLGSIHFRYLVSEFGNFLLLLPNFLVVVWFLIASSPFLACTNLFVVWGNCWNYLPLLLIGSEVKHTVRQMWSLCRECWCVAVIVSYHLEFRYPSRCERWCFASRNMGWNSLQNLGLFLVVEEIIDIDRGHKHSQLCIVKFDPQQVYDAFVVHGVTVAIQNVDCILKLFIKDVKFLSPFIPVGKGLHYFLGLVDNMSFITGLWYLAWSATISIRPFFSWS